MKRDLLNLLRCPKTGQRLLLESNFEILNEEVMNGWLSAENCQERYPIINGIPRFVHEQNYADSFGRQWNHFRQTQLDSFSGHPISERRFRRATGWTPEELNGQWVLDAGCGSGRFAEIALNFGAKVVALDYSTAVEACYENLKHHANFHVVQADIYALPFQNGTFPFVYSLGVLQHTPDVAKAVGVLPVMVKTGGRLCVDVYWKRFRTMLHMKYFLRPLTKRLPQQSLFRGLELVTPTLLRISQNLGKVPLFGRVLKRMIPIADYTGIYPLNDKQLNEWALLDTFDMLSPKYDNPQTPATLHNLLELARIKDIEVFQEGMLVGRGCKQ